MKARGRGEKICVGEARGSSSSSVVLAKQNVAPAIAMASSTEPKLAELCTTYRRRSTKRKLDDSPAEKVALPQQQTIVPAETSVALVDGRLVIKDVQPSTVPAAADTLVPLTANVKYERWAPEETRQFYAALQQCGTDFTLMQSYFPGRTQRQLKNKFHREDKQHSNLVALALDPKIASPMQSRRHDQPAAAANNSDRRRDSPPSLSTSPSPPPHSKPPPTIPPATDPSDSPRDLADEGGEA